MGACSSNEKQNLKPDTTQEVTKDMFQYIMPIGRGGFGVVHKVKLIKNDQNYAMKVMSKQEIIQKKSINSVLNEKRLLCKLNDDFIINMYLAFQDHYNLYLVMDLINGGDLRYNLNKEKSFNEQQTKFIIACILKGLEYLHNNKIIHRDVKPENLIFEKNGYLRLTDLGIARYHRNDNATDQSGTPGYMAPEVLCQQNHSYPVDFYAVGIIGYECVMAQRPYQGYTNRKQLRDLILDIQSKITRTNVPEGWSDKAIDFINKLMIRKPSERLGFYGLAEIYEHPWLSDFDWESLQNKKMDAPFKPQIKDEDLNIFLQQQIEQDQKNGQNVNLQGMTNFMDEQCHKDSCLLNEQIQRLFDEYSQDERFQDKSSWIKVLK